MTSRIGELSKVWFVCSLRRPWLSKRLRTRGQTQRAPGQDAIEATLGVVRVTHKNGETRDGRSARREAWLIPEPCASSSCFVERPVLRFATARSLLGSMIVLISFPLVSRGETRLERLGIQSLVMFSPSPFCRFVLWRQLR